MIAGFIHPLLGIDHLLAMTCLGIWAAQRGPRAILALPALFLLGLAAGGALGFAFGMASAVEAAVIGSAIALCVAIALRPAIPHGLAGVLAAIFGIAHGVAHGAELPMGETLLGYGTGFMLSSLLLHGLGAGVTLLWQRTPALR